MGHIPPSLPPPYPAPLLKVVGFGTGWHAAAVMGQVSPKLHAMRLGQCCEVEVEMAAWGRQAVRDDRGLTHMQLDGEPWPQPIPLAPTPSRQASGVGAAAAAAAAAAASSSGGSAANGAGHGAAAAPLRVGVGGAARSWEAAGGGGEGVWGG